MEGVGGGAYNEQKNDDKDNDANADDLKAIVVMNEKDIIAISHNMK